MSSLIDNEIFQGIAIVIGAAIVIASSTKLYSFITFKSDEKKIFEFIKTSKRHFRSSEAITSNTGILPEQIAVVVARSKKMGRSSKKKEMWCLIT